VAALDLREDGIREALVYLSLGSNLGDRNAILDGAVAGLAATPGIRVTGVSHLYRTAPVGMVDQPDYLNLVVELRTSLEPVDVLTETQRIERAAGRVRDVRWGPRTLDIDLVWYDGLTVRDDRLEVPHPRMLERRFVMEPLAELAPDLALPDGRSVQEALRALSAQRVERIDPP
jgi:2-amino-4-hydroxy-6-hydroxymethyldihydropteridine diphosphokinase